MADAEDARLALLAGVVELKRVRSAGHPNSVAERLFRGAWAALSRGEPLARVMLRVCAAAIAAVTLGDLDAPTLSRLEMPPSVALGILQRGFDAASRTISPALGRSLRQALAEGAPAAGDTPAFVDRLAHQPRAGITAPGRARWNLLPAESHAEHCLSAAVIGVLTSDGYGADAGQVFLAGLAHHLHNAMMPDSGYAGELALGEWLAPMAEHARETALAELTPRLADAVRAALAPIGGHATPEARAFHAGDVLDRVLEVRRHLATGSLTMRQVLGDDALVHEGPVKAFQDRVLAEAGLAG